MDALSTLQSLIRDGSFVPADAAAEMIERASIDVDTLMVRLLSVAERLSVTPISNVTIGAVVQGLPRTGTIGNLFLGANLEFPGGNLGESVHAEQAAVNNASLQGETGIQSVAVTASPCGHCRQFLYELRNAENIDVLRPTDSLPTNTSYMKDSLAKLLPAPFGPEHCGLTERLMDACSRCVTLDTIDELVHAARLAAEQSYAPYSKNWAGVALQLKTPSGMLVCGRIAENAAFNPTLSPMASALSQLNLCGHQTGDIKRAVLVEIPGATSQIADSENLLSLAAPNITLESFEGAAH